MNVKCESSKMKTVLAVLLSVVVAFAMMGICTGNTNAATKAPKKIYLAKQAGYVDYGAKVKVYVKKVKPSKAKKNVKWAFTKSKYKKYASLKSKKSTSVYVYGKKAGTVKVKAVSKYRSSVSKTVSIKVKNLKAKAISIANVPGTLEKGKTATLKATVTAPQKYGYKTQTTTWKSSNTAVATVSAAGAVTGVKAGTAVITASNDGKTAAATINVIETITPTSTTAGVKTYTLPSTTAKATTSFMYNGKMETVDFTPADLQSFFNVNGSTTNVQFWTGTGGSGVVNTFPAAKFSFKSADGKYEITKGADGNANLIKVVKNGAITYWKYDAAKSLVGATKDNYTLTLFSEDGTVSKDAVKLTNGVLSMSFNGVTYTAVRNDAHDAVTVTANGAPRFTIKTANKDGVGPFTIEADSTWAGSSDLMMAIAGYTN